MAGSEAYLPVKSDSYREPVPRLKSMVNSCALTIGNGEAVMQKEDNDEDKVSIHAGVRFAGSAAGN